MTIRLPSLLAVRVDRGRRRAVCLLATAWLVTFLPIVHAAADVASHHDRAGAAASSAGPVVEGSCHSGCTDRRHHHATHDPATCLACKAVHAAGVLTRARGVACVVGVEGRAHVAALTPAVGAARGPHAIRGPPAA